MQTGRSLGLRVRAADGRRRARCKFHSRGALVLAGFVLTAVPITVRAQPMAPPGGGGGGGGLDLGIGLHAGTTGLGIDASKLLFSHLGVRGEFNYLGFGLSETFSDVTYSAKLRLQSIPLLVDLYPGARGSFHVSGGVVFNQTHLVGTGVPGAGGTLTINHDTYTSSEIGVLSGAFRYPSTGGYFGLGFGTPAKKSMIAGTFNLGVILGKPSVSLSATGASTNPALASDLAAQQATTQKDVNKLTFFPVLSSGIMLRL
jgi:hypothetical protein